MWSRILFALIASAMLFSFGCVGNVPSVQNYSTNTVSNAPAGGSIGETMAKSNLSSSSNPVVTFVTTKGTFKAEIYFDRAPVSSANFLKLVRSGFYNNLTFHRYVAGFVIQGGDPRGDGTGGSDETIPLEIVPELTHVKGSLGMARSNDPDSASSQFYVSLEDIHDLDGSYAVFGQVIEGMDVVLNLRQGDRMTKVSVN